MCDTCFANYFPNSDKTDCFTGNVDGYYLQEGIYYAFSRVRLAEKLGLTLTMHVIAVCPIITPKLIQYKLFYWDNQFLLSRSY
jgi:hypothetical protein